jgi:hypothetical protein
VIDVAALYLLFGTALDFASNIKAGSSQQIAARKMR